MELQLLREALLLQAPKMVADGALHDFCRGVVNAAETQVRLRHAGDVRAPGELTDGTHARMQRQG